MESCSDILPSTFVSIPSEQCVANVPVTFFPSFPNLISSETSAYYFECTNSILAAVENIFMGVEECSGASIQHPIPLNVCKETEVVDVNIFGESAEGESEGQEIGSGERRLFTGLDLNEGSYDDWELSSAKDSVIKFTVSDLNSTNPNLPLPGYDDYSFLTMYDNLTIHENITSNGTMQYYSTIYDNLTMYENITSNSTIQYYGSIYENMTTYENMSSNSTVQHHERHGHHSKSHFFYIKYSCYTGEQ